jgi:DNA invertase Pin-like site-specific DNA recombinase
MGYRRVSTEEQGESGLGLTAQTDAIRAACAYRDWTLLGICEDVASGKSRARRPGLATALDAVHDGTAGTLMVAKLDRLSRSMLDFATIMEDAHRSRWNLVALDLGVDLSTPAGELLASVMAAMAQWERAMIGQRTREAMAVLKDQGVHVGREQVVGEEVARLIRQRRAADVPYAVIARELNAQGIPTGHGGRRWWPSTVRGVELREDLTTNQKESP